MSAICPVGHTSTSTDYCDTCGSPMTISGAPATPATPKASAVSLPPPAPSASASASASASMRADATQECPHCHTINRASDLFCEVCGYDFTTGVMPRPAGGEPSFLDLDLPTPNPEPQSYDPVDLPVADLIEGVDGEANANSASSAPQLDDEHGNDVRSAEGAADVPVEDPPEPPDAPASSPASSCDPPAAPAPIEDALPDSEVEDDDDPAGRPAPGVSVAPSEADPPAASPPPRTHTAPPTRVDSRPTCKPSNRPPSREVAGDWVVEIWVDPQWYAVQDSDETCPSAAPPDIVRIIDSSALIGRRSSSRGLTPDIDCGIDTGVSRRQALLAGDGRRWWIEDLDSANGTYVAEAAGPLPTTPLKAGQRVEVDAGDRVYVGAWTRLVVRPATESEIAGLG